ncbi:hypothetical protein CEXT_82061 [Caerostris extrusa]|uniref:Uncharacterized protein n=1 Tax=Caerostris extrusa TaxID=172846 RepID=A0AAV4YDC9_CAEEX|nr:hypothetical protein CEXT_82061 [Caerostris extrusa]
MRYDLQCSSTISLHLLSLDEKWKFRSLQTTPLKENPSEFRCAASLHIVNDETCRGWGVRGKERGGGRRKQALPWQPSELLPTSEREHVRLGQASLLSPDPLGIPERAGWRGREGE